MKSPQIRALEGEGRERAFRLSFSSEDPCEQTDWWGDTFTEILDHGAESAVSLTRLNSLGVLLYNHHPDDAIGKVERAWLEGHRGYADVVFADDDLAENIYRKVKGGFLRGVSVGYRVDAWEEVRAGKQSSDGRFTGPCQVARSWTPFELSIVTIPADATVGVGRSFRPPNRRDMFETYMRQLIYNHNIMRRKPV